MPIGQMRDDAWRKRELAELRALIDRLPVDQKRAVAGMHDDCRDAVRGKPLLGFMALQLLCLEMQVEWDQDKGYVSTGDDERKGADPPPPAGSEPIPGRPAE